MKMTPKQALNLMSKVAQKIDFVLMNRELYGSYFERTLTELVKLYNSARLLAWIKGGDVSSTKNLSIDYLLRKQN